MPDDTPGHTAEGLLHSSVVLHSSLLYIWCYICGLLQRACVRVFSELYVSWACSALLIVVQLV